MLVVLVALISDWLRKVRYSAVTLIDELCSVRFSAEPADIRQRIHNKKIIDLIIYHLCYALYPLQ